MIDLNDLSWPQTVLREKKHPDKYSHNQESPKTPETIPIGDRTISPSTNWTIAADFPAIATYNPNMFDEENSRLKGLLIATILAYILAIALSLFMNRIVNSDSYVVWFLEYSWVIYLSWFLLFLVYCWIPLTIFLFVQGLILKRKYSLHAFNGDRTIGNLSIVIPIFMVAIFVGTRLMYGG